MPVCRPCRRVLLGRDPEAGEIPAAEAWPVFNRLVEHYGSKRAVCDALDVRRDYLSRPKAAFRKKTVERASALLHEIEIEIKGRPGDPEVIEGKHLVPVLAKWRKEWEAEYPQGVGGFGAGENVEFMGPIGYLNWKTGIHARKISGIMAGEFKYVGLYRHADPILTAIRRHDLIMNGEIPVIPNPSWPVKSYRLYMKAQGVF